jgi:hypothetical protein
MDFKEQQRALKNFIIANYYKYLPELMSGPEITTEFLDFDKFKNDFTLFLDFQKIDFSQSAYQDDCGDIERLSLTVYLVRRNSTTTVLQDDVLDAAYAFYKLVKENTSLGIAEHTVISDITFFNYVEGTKNLACAELDLSLEIEV